MLPIVVVVVVYMLFLPQQLLISKLEKGGKNFSAEEKNKIMKVSRFVKSPRCVLHLVNLVDSRFISGDVDRFFIAPRI